MGDWDIVARTPAAGPEADPWAVVARTPHTYTSGAPPGFTPEAPTHPDHPTFWHSFYDSGIAPIVDTIQGTFQRGDFGEKVVSDLLDSFKTDLGKFIMHPDIRNLPLVAEGPTAISNRMQEQVNNGDYTGALGTLAGFAAPLVAPEAAAAMRAKLPAAARVAYDAADATANTVKAAANATAKTASAVGKAAGAGVRAAAPDVATGVAKAAGGAELGHLIPGPQFLNILAGSAASDVIGRITGKGGGALTQIGEGLAKGGRAARATYAAERAAQASEARLAAEEAIYNPDAPHLQAEARARAAAEAQTPPAPQEWEPGQPGTPEAWAPYPAEQPQGRPAWEPAPREAPPAWEPGPVTRDDARISGVPAAEAAAIDAAPDARETLSPEMAARADELRAETHAPGAALTDAQRLEDAIHRHAAYLRMQAQDIEWANRARKADRFAGYLIKNDLEATPDNLARAARELDERGVPSDETVPMIEDRLAWHQARTAAAAPAEAAPTLEEQLQASIEAVKSGRGRQQPGPTAETGHVQSEIPVSASGSGESMDTGGTRGRPALPASGGTGAAVYGEPAPVDVPGEQRTYPATYAVKELADVQPSHLGATFEPNPRYEYENDRLYDDPRNQRKIVDWSTRANFNPRNLLNTAPTSELGPPVVDARGNVWGGNGRTMILQRVYQSNPEGAAAYRAALDRTASHYGIDPASYAHMKEPVLVRELPGEISTDRETARRAITDFNKTGTAALTPAERAIADAKGVSQKTLDDIAARMDRLGPDATLLQTLEGRQGLEVLGNLMNDNVISPQEGAALATETKLTRAGKERVSGLMLGRFFQDAKQMDALPDAMRNKLERMAAPLARAESAAGYSLQPTIKSALDLLEDADAHGAATLDDYLKQQGLFSERAYSPEAIAFAKALKSTNPVELTHAARRYAERAKYAEEYQGPGMFGDIAAPLPPREAFLDSFEHLAK